MSTMTIALLKIIMVCLVMAGCFMVLVGGISAYEAYSSQFWPKTTGEIIQSSVYTYTDVYGNRTYRGKIKYEYTINQLENAEEHFTGERIGIDPLPPFENRTIAEASLAQYAKGAIVDVYYSPNNPQKSILEPGFSFTKLIYPGAGLLVLAAAFLLMLFGRQK